MSVNNLSQSELLNLIEKRLSEILKIKTNANLLLAAMRYSSLDGGKRIRPLLVIAAGQLSRANLIHTIEIGCAIELIHCYSLIHDDLPAMDDDDLRRGRKTCHKQYNEAIAILAGDALQSIAFEILSAPTLNILAQQKILHLIANSAGINGMAGGQAIDLMSTGVKLSLEDLKQMHSMKTGALIKASILTGFLAGEQFDLSLYNRLNKVADNLGLLFQIIDDILDATQTTITLGKTANKDLLNDKATYVNILGLDQARKYAKLTYDEIMSDLHNSTQSSQLTQLVNTIYQRTK